MIAQLENLMIELTPNANNAILDAIAALAHLQIAHSVQKIGH